MSQVLVVGAPRSGTTWVAHVLCAASGATYVEEPDNHFRFGYAFRAKHALGRGAYPRIGAGEELDGAEEFGALWRYAFEPAETGVLRRLARGSANRLVTLARPPRVADALAGSPPDGRLRLAERLAVPQRASDRSQSVLVKSVYAPLCAEWVSSRHAARTVVVLRRPLDVVASWLALGWLGRGWPDPLTSVPAPLVDELSARYAPSPTGSRLVRAAWLIGVLTCALAESARENPDWARVEHEDLYTAPLERFPPLAAAVGLEWSEAGDRLIENSTRPGTGYETRRAPAQLRDAWRTRLSDAQARELNAVLERMPLSI